MVWVPRNPQYGNTPASPYGTVVCNYPNSPNAGLHNGTLKEDAGGQRVGEYKLGCYEYIDCDPSLYRSGYLPEACPTTCPEPVVTENPSLCYDEAGKWETHPRSGVHFDAGGVACTSDQDMKICIWPNAPLYYSLTDDRSMEIV